MKTAPTSSGMSLPQHASAQQLQPVLGISVQYLSTRFVQEVQAAGHDPFTTRIYDLEPLVGPPENSVIRRKGKDVTSPVDGRKGASLVHSLQHEEVEEQSTSSSVVGPAAFMLSYSWSYTLDDIICTLMEFCKAQKMDPKTTYIWMDCLCINQHRVVEQKEKGGSGLLHFEEEFPQLLRQMGHILVMFAPSWKDPMYLKRAWCIFELFTAHTNGCQVTIVMPPREERNLRVDLFGDQGSFTELYRALARTSVQNAKASFEQDRDMILGMIQKGVGSYHVLDNRVNELLREWVHGVIEGILQEHQQANSCRDDALAVADVMDRYGEFLRRTGDLEASLSMFQKSKSLREETLGCGHSETARTYNNVGNALTAKGDFDAALVEFQKCLTIRTREYGSDHPKVAVVLRNIGFALKEKGDYEAAEMEWRRALPIVASCLGINHPETKYTTYMIQTLRKTSGKHDNESLARDIQGELADIDQSNTAANYNARGISLKENGEYDLALKEHHQALAIQESILGSEHPNVGDTYHLIGNVATQQGDLNKALDWYHRSLSIRESVLPSDHPDLLDTRAAISGITAT